MKVSTCRVVITESQPFYVENVCSSAVKDVEGPVTSLRTGCLEALVRSRV